MTAPNPAELVDEPNIPIQVTTAIQPGPDGKPWVQLQLVVVPPAGILGGVSGHILIMPPKTAEVLTQLLAQQLPDAARQARLAAGGIIVPGSGQGAIQAAQQALSNGHRP